MSPENLVSDFEFPTKGVPAIPGILSYGCIGHFQGQDVDSEEFLPAFKSSISKVVDLLNFVVCHRHAASRDFLAVNRDKIAGPNISSIILVGVANIRRQVEIALWIHLVWGDK